MAKPLAKQQETKKRALFAADYAKHGNRTLAAINAGYARNTASRQGARLLAETEVLNMIEVERARLNARLEVSDRRLLAEVAALGFSNICELFNDDGSMKAISELSEATQRSIKQLKVKVTPTEDGVDQQLVTIEMHPKLPALQQLIAIKGMVKPDGNKQTKVKVDIKGLTDA